jgi:hypothetical protein
MKEEEVKKHSQPSHRAPKNEIHFSLARAATAPFSCQSLVWERIKRERATRRTRLWNSVLFKLHCVLVLCCGEKGWWWEEKQKERE